MQYFKLTIPLVSVFLVIQLTSRAQPGNAFVNPFKIYDTLKPTNSGQNASYASSFNTRSYILPVFMIAYGFTAIENNYLKNVNKHLKYELYIEHPHHTLQIDDYMQYAPAVMAMGLNIAGIKGEHNFKDRTMLLLISNVMTSVTVSSIKKRTHQLRPDGSTFTSFPSAHTALAFTNAEYIRMEYKDISPWYGIVGYTMAISTGYLRMYNNKHWLSDVVAGAGVGILSTKLTFWLYPVIQHSLFKSKLPKTAVMPTYQDGAIGLGLVHHF